MPVPRRILAVAAAAAAVLASVAPADAASVATQPCVRSFGPTAAATMPIAATGFTPGSLVTVSYSTPIRPAAAYLTAGTADANGTFKTRTTPPPFNRPTTPFRLGTTQQTFSLLAADNVNPALVARTPFKQILVSYSTSPSSGAPTRRVTHMARGFMRGRKVYVHFRYGGITRANLSLGKPSGPCGIASRRARLLPTRSRAGVWNLYVDQRKTYSAKTGDSERQLNYSLPIRLVPR
jgi:hypothetical protein